MRTWLRSTRGGTRAVLALSAVALLAALAVMTTPTTSVEAPPAAGAHAGVVDPTAVGKSCGSLLRPVGLPRPADCEGPLNDRAVLATALLCLAVAGPILLGAARARSRKGFLLAAAVPTAYFLMLTLNALTTHVLVVNALARDGYLSGLEHVGSLTLALPTGLLVGAAVPGDRAAVLALYVAGLAQLALVVWGCRALYLRAGSAAPAPDWLTDQDGQRSR